MAANNQLESPLPSWLMTKPDIIAVDIRNNSFGMIDVRLDWIGLEWIGLDWIGLDWIGLDWIGLHDVGMMNIQSHNHNHNLTQ